MGDKTAAEALASKIREKLKAGELQISPGKKIPTFGEYAMKFLSNVTHLKYSTMVSYDTILRRHVTPLLDRPLDQIKRADIKDLIFAKQKKDGLSPKTVNNIKAFISTMFSHAFEDEIIAVHPAMRLGKLITSKERKADINPLTREEAKVFLDAVQIHYPRHYAFFLCALRTGMRLGEIQALTWEDIDFRSHFIELKRGYTKGRFTTPKSGKIRRVDMSPQLADTLKMLQIERKREALAKWGGQVPDLVFVDETGGVIDESNLRKRVFHPALEKSGLRRIRIHDLRHTFASLLIQNGESLAYVRDQLGHSSIQITVDTYGHLVPGANREAVAKLDDEFHTYGLNDRVHGGCIEGNK